MILEEAALCVVTSPTTHPEPSFSWEKLTVAGMWLIRNHRFYNSPGLSKTIASTILLILDWCLNRASCCLGIQFDGLFQKHYHFVQTFANGLALVGVTGLRHICRSFNSWGTIGLSFPNFILVSQILAAIVNNLTKKKSPIACVATKWISRPYTCEHRQQLYRTIVVRRRLE